MTELVHRIRRFLVAQDCWYLISGFLMLLGCLLVSQSPGADSADLASGLKLQSVMLIYQVAVVGLAIYIRRRLSLEADAFNLAIVALVLLPDPTLFSARFWGISVEAGMSVNAGLLLATSVMLLALVEAADLPVPRASIVAWLMTLGAVFTAGYGFEPGDHRANLWTMELLALAPLAVAAATARWNDPDGDRAGPRTSSRDQAHPVLWGDPARIYRRYVAAVFFAYPVLILLRQMHGLGGVFSVPMEFPHLAPALLALGVLAVKASPRVLELRKALAVLDGLALLLAAASRPPAHGGLGLFALMLGASAAFWLWIYWQSGRREFPWLGTLCASALAAGTDAESALRGLVTLEPGPLAVLAAMALLHALQDRGFWQIAGAGTSAALLGCALSPLPKLWCVPAALHLGGFILLACIHLYPRKDLKDAAPFLAFALMASLALPMLAGGPADELLRILLAAEAAVFFAAGLATGMTGYAVAGAVVAGAQLAVAARSWVGGLDLERLFWTWSGPAAILFAFGTLALGFLSSQSRSRRRS